MNEGYGWVITEDIICNGDDNNVMGPSDVTMSKEDIISNGKAFTMYDDDGELYYKGYVAGDYTGLEPLDDFGMPNAGCTDIKINGKSI